MKKGLHRFSFYQSGENTLKSCDMEPLPPPRMRSSDDTINPLFGIQATIPSKHPGALELQEFRRPAANSTEISDHRDSDGSGAGSPPRSLQMYGSDDRCIDPALPQPPGTDRRTASTAAGRSILRLRSATSSLVESLDPVKNARRTQDWCRDEGFPGSMVVFILCMTIVGILINLVLHCTTIFSWVVGRPGARKMVKVGTEVSVAMGVIGCSLMVKLACALVAITCRHSATHKEVGTRVRQQKNSAWRFMRAYNMYELYMTPGGRFFDTWEFSRELVEFVLQTIAVVGYANNGVDREFLIGYTLIILLNSFGAVILMLPKIAPGRWDTAAPEKRATLERSVLLLDVVCDALCTLVRESWRGGPYVGLCGYVVWRWWWWW